MDRHGATVGLEYDSEHALGETLLQQARVGQFECTQTIQARFFTPQRAPELKSQQHSLQSYDALLTSLKAQAKHDVEVPF
jgi:hypothetical protein